MSVQNGQAFSN